MRLTRDRGKYADRRRRKRRSKRYGPDGPGCCFCEPRNGHFRRETLRAREHAGEMAL